MTDDDPFGLPRKDPLNRGFRFSPLQEKRKAHAEKDLTVWIEHSSHPRGEAPWLREFFELEIDYCVGKYEGFGLSVEEDEFSEKAARDCPLVDLVSPFVGRLRAQVPLEVDVDAACPSAFARAWGSPRDRFWKCAGPLSDMGIMELVRRYEVTNSPDRREPSGQLGIERDWGMQE